MMLAASALSSAVAATAAVFSPCANTCMKRVSATHFRYEPYATRVFPAAYASTPLKSDSASPVTAMAKKSVTVTAAERHPSFSITAPSPISTAPATFTQVSITVSPAVAAPAADVAAAVNPNATRYAVIRFKQETQTFIAPFRTVIGETVVVEGDRGENIGIVTEITQAVPSFDVTSQIVRKASDKDLATLKAQREREATALKQVQGLAASIGLHATIEDVEYQFDLNKLTIFVRRSAKGGFVDFRKLQRGLFREFRCRIWCSYMDEVEAVENGPRIR